MTREDVLDDLTDLAHGAWGRGDVDLFDILSDAEVWVRDLIEREGDR